MRLFVSNRWLQSCKNIPPVFTCVSLELAHILWGWRTCPIRLATHTHAFVFPYVGQRDPQVCRLFKEETSHYATPRPRGEAIDNEPVIGEKLGRARTNEESVMWQSEPHLFFSSLRARANTRSVIQALFTLYYFSPHSGALSHPRPAVSLFSLHTLSPPSLCHPLVLFLFIRLHSPPTLHPDSRDCLFRSARSSFLSFSVPLPPASCSPHPLGLRGQWGGNKAEKHWTRLEWAS